MKKNRLDRGHIKLVLPRYKQSNLREKSAIIRDFCLDYGVGRKAVVKAFARADGKIARSFKGALGPKQRPGRPSRFDEATVVWWLQTLWVAMRKMNVKAMKEALPRWLKFNPDPSFPIDVKEKILLMSASTMERLLSSYKQELARKMRCTTRRPPMKTLRQLIPLHPPGERLHYNKPGFVQADTVAHCGTRLQGEFAWTVNMTDTVSGWCEEEAILNKQIPEMISALQKAERRLPFKLWGFHSDNGSEFLNKGVIDYFDRAREAVIFIRGRPYKKNDQAMIEQKNWTHVRQLFGYHRYDTPELVTVMNEIYRNEHRLLMNFFVPQMKLIEKHRTGSQIKKRFDLPKTPYQRLLESKYLTEIQKQELKDCYQKLNPFELSRRLDEKLKIVERMLKKRTAPAEQTPTEEPEAQADKPLEKKAS